MGNPVSAKSALDIARTATNEAMTQTAATLPTWDRGLGMLTSILISGVSWRWYAAGYVVPAGSTSVTVTATGGGVWVQGTLPTGPSGRGVSSIAASGATATVTYSDATTSTYAMPVGAAGKGVSGITAAGTTATVTYSDATTSTYALPAGPAGTSAPTFVTITGSDFNILVAGTTALGTPPALATGAVITISGGDVYATITGTTPTTASPPYADTTQIQINPLTDAVAFQAIIKTGAPRLIGYWLKAGS